ncbi:hypothetical protein HPB48_005555 [Haemaphysalis longicornis]|uniref:RING-type domain-containing protein n=1 Tax=Haemaphysalis longicornis TaxID=44386 RepID=A0A9J6H6S6_HAELO|nr:hypothetical protein HPB48_005555 [Haemaphysalis longicornis]
MITVKKNGCESKRMLIKETMSIRLSFEASFPGLSVQIGCLALYSLSHLACAHRSSSGEKTTVEQLPSSGEATTPPKPSSLPEKLLGVGKVATKSTASLPAEPSTELALENLRLKEQRLCKVCLDAEVGVVFLPCGHLAACPACASALTTCPICRSDIAGTVRTFLS